jgi:hypothetical protein
MEKTMRNDVVSHTVFEEGDIAALAEILKDTGEPEIVEIINDILSRCTFEGSIESFRSENILLSKVYLGCLRKSGGKSIILAAIGLQELLQRCFLEEIVNPTLEMLSQNLQRVDLPKEYRETLQEIIDLIQELTDQDQENPTGFA